MILGVITVSLLLTGGALAGYSGERREGPIPFGVSLARNDLDFKLAQCHVNYVILDQFGDETSFLYVGATLRLVCVCDPADAIEPFNTKTIFRGYDKDEGSNKLKSRYYTTPDGIVTLKVTQEMAGDKFWCQNSGNYLQIPGGPICEPGSDNCYNDNCVSSSAACLDARRDQKTYKQVCVAGEHSVRVQADLCRHKKSGSTDVAFLEVTQPTNCPQVPAKAGGFVTKWAENLIELGTTRTVLDVDPFSEHKVKCIGPTTPQCYLVKRGGSVSKVNVCGTCKKAGDVIKVVLDTKKMRGSMKFHSETDLACKLGKLVCGDGKNYRFFIYLILRKTKYFIPDDLYLDQYPVCDWPQKYDGNRTIFPTPY
jgi:hypothetical protein